MKRPPFNPSKLEEAASKGVTSGALVQKPSGEPCSYCTKPCREDGHEFVRKGVRLAFCCADCFQAGTKEKSQTELRALAFERDKGVCAKCEEDCGKLDEEAKALRERHEKSPSLKAELDWKMFLHRMRLWGFREHDAKTTFWQANHKTERAAGGPDALSNIETLCARCHRAATKAFTSRRFGTPGREKPRRRIGR